jgi:hypothetical protein
MKKSNSKTKLFYASLGMLLVFTSMSGCNGTPSADYASLGLVEISGTVTLDGQPLQGAMVHFVDTDQTYCTGLTDTSGRYRMMLDSRKSGVIPGDKIVRISSRVPAGEGEIDEDPDASSKEQQAEKVPACYNKDSKLRIKVATADSAMDFDLKSDCSTTTFK